MYLQRNWFIFLGVAFPARIPALSTESTPSSDYTIEKKLASAHRRLAEAEGEQIVLNEGKGPSVTDQVGRGSDGPKASIFEAFERPVFSTSSDIYVPKKRKTDSTEMTHSKKKKILQKLQFE